MTTDGRDTNDTTPPTVPCNLHATIAQPDGETWLAWDQSADANTPQSLIVYRVYINGVFDSSVLGDGRWIGYGTPFSQDTYSVIAVDESGNELTPATLVVDNR
jgi:hypothetical protein